MLVNMICFVGECGHGLRTAECEMASPITKSVRYMHIIHIVYCFIIFRLTQQFFSYMFVCLFTVLRPAQEFFTYMETSPLPVKGCKI
jgi:hypothetical protein